MAGCPSAGTLLSAGFADRTDDVSEKRHRLPVCPERAADTVPRRAVRAWRCSNADQAPGPPQKTWGQLWNGRGRGTGWLRAAPHRASAQAPSGRGRVRTALGFLLRPRPGLLQPESHGWAAAEARWPDAPTAQAASHYFQPPRTLAGKRWFSN